MVINLPLIIFSIDPATTISGWSVLRLNELSPLSIDVVARGVIDGDKLVRQNKDISKQFSAQFSKIECLEEEYKRLFSLYKPDVVVSESAYGYSHLSALIALTLAIHAVRKAARYVLNKDIITIPPTISKKSFTESGGADKDKMRIAYNTVEYLNRLDGDISEHEIDAIAHGIGFIRRDIIKDVEQISALDKKRKKRNKEKNKQT